MIQSCLFGMRGTASYYYNLCRISILFSLCNSGFHLHVSRGTFQFAQSYFSILEGVLEFFLYLQLHMYLLLPAPDISRRLLCTSETAPFTHPQPHEHFLLPCFSRSLSPNLPPVIVFYSVSLLFLACTLVYHSSPPAGLQLYPICIYLFDRFILTIMYLVLLFILVAYNSVLCQFTFCKQCVSFSNDLLVNMFRSILQSRNCVCNSHPVYQCSTFLPILTRSDSSRPINVL